MFVSLEGIAMAPVQKVYRLVWGGRLFTTESWSCSLSIASGTGFNLAASNFKVLLTAFMARPGTIMSSAARLDFIKCNEINPMTRKYVLQTSNSYFQNDMVIGTQAAVPGQNSVAVTTRTALSRGRAHAGRFYLPCAPQAINAETGQFSTLIAGTMATSAWSMITDVNTLVGVGSSVAIFSAIGQSVEPVNGVKVGRVVDTVRSRRSSLLEDYSFAGA